MIPSIYTRWTFKGRTKGYDEMAMAAHNLFCSIIVLINTLLYSSWFIVYIFTAEVERIKKQKHWISMAPLFVNLNDAWQMNLIINLILDG
jgi:hypothetical protein